MNDVLLRLVSKEKTWYSVRETNVKNGARQLYNHEMRNCLLLFHTSHTRYSLAKSWKQTMARDHLQCALAQARPTLSMYNHLVVNAYISAGILGS